MEVIQSTLIDSVPGPVSQGHGGISKGDPSAGTGGDEVEPLKKITTSDRAGAWISTLLVLVFVVGGAWYVDVDDEFDFLIDCAYVPVWIWTITVLFPGQAPGETPFVYFAEVAYEIFERVLMHWLQVACLLTRGPRTIGVLVDGASCTLAYFTNNAIHEGGRKERWIPVGRSSRDFET